MLKWLYLGCIESNKIYYFILTVSFYLLNVAPGTRVTVYTAHICTSHIAIRPCCSKPCHCPKRTTFITSLSSMIPPDHLLSSFQLTTTSALTQLSNPLRSVSHWLVSPCFIASPLPHVLTPAPPLLGLHGPSSQPCLVYLQLALLALSFHCIHLRKPQT